MGNERPLKERDSGKDRDETDAWGGAEIVKGLTNVEHEEGGQPRETVLGVDTWTWGVNR